MENEKLSQLEKSNEKLCGLIEDLKEAFFTISDEYDICNDQDNIMLEKFAKLHDWRTEEFQEIMDK